MGTRLTREERKWMMLWTVKGRPERLSLAMFANLPRAAAEALEDEPEFFEAYDAQRNRYTLHSPHPYLYEATRWHAVILLPDANAPFTVTGTKAVMVGQYHPDTIRGNFETVMATIRQWVGP